MNRDAISTVGRDAISKQKSPPSGGLSRVGGTLYHCLQLDNELVVALGAALDVAAGDDLDALKLSGGA